MMLQATEIASNRAGGRWVSETVYADYAGIKPQTLRNQRYQDRQAGRSGAREGYPVYKRFGRTVRYWLPIET